MKPSFVVPFYGADIGGGAETLCRRLAENLVQRGVEVEVLTTTLRDLASDWSHNYHEQGTYLINGVTVRRFLVRPVDTDLFVPINRKLMAGDPVTLEEEIDYMNNAVNSDALFEYIGDNQRDRVYFFIPYLFGTSLNGSAVSPHKSYLIPCLHNEGYARMKVTGAMFDRVNAALFLSKAEMRLAESLYGGLRHCEPVMMGCGVDEIYDADAAGFRSRFGLGEDPFILYVGRRDATKNTPLLVEYFRRYKKLKSGSPLRLVLIGSGAVPIPGEVASSVIDLGFTSVSDKSGAYAAATVLCQPSRMESFSIVIMESWLCGRPVMVHSRCPVTLEHVNKSGGGLSFETFPEFYETVEALLENPELAGAMGKKGGEYARAGFSWDVICDRFTSLLDACKEAAV